MENIDLCKQVIQNCVDQTFEIAFKYFMKFFIYNPSSAKPFPSKTYELLVPANPIYFLSFKCLNLVYTIKINSGKEKGML